MTNAHHTTALITGANRGLGLEFTRQYLTDGWRVIATARQPDKAAALHTLRDAYPGQLRIEALDVGDFACIDALSGRLADQPIDLLINNAGIFGARKELDGDPGQKLGHLDYPAWREIFDINTLAPVRIAELFLDRVAASQEKKIVSVSSSIGSVAIGEQFGHVYAYGAAKAALNKAMAYLALDAKPKGVFVGLVCPGWVKTDMGSDYAPLTPEEAITGVRNVIKAATLDDTGSFKNYKGETVPW